jgi:hypothetical protein
VCQTLANGDDDHVSSRVTERIVDIFEVIEIDVDDSGFPPPAVGVLKHIRQQPVKMGTVGQTGQGVVARCMHGLRFADGKALGHVAGESRYSDYHRRNHEGGHPEERIDPCQHLCARPVHLPGDDPDGRSCRSAQSQLADALTVSLFLCKDEAVKPGHMHDLRHLFTAQWREANHDRRRNSLRNYRLNLPGNCSNRKEMRFPFTETTPVSKIE